MYKLIAVDMDGTLLNSEHKISTYTKNTIKKAKEKGVKVVLASGRPVAGLIQYAEELDLLTESDYVVGFNGCVIKCIKTNEILQMETITGRDLKEIYELSREIGVAMHAYIDDVCKSPGKSKATLQDTTLNRVKLVQSTFEEIKDDDVVIKAMFADEKVAIDDAIVKTPPLLKNRYSISRSADIYLEFLNPNINKGKGVIAVANHLGIKAEEIIAFGDAENDKYMLEIAGVGVAMGNAYKEVKQIADFVTSSNNEDGVAIALEKYVL